MGRKRGGLGKLKISGLASLTKKFPIGIKSTYIFPVDTVIRKSRIKSFYRRTYDGCVESAELRENIVLNIRFEPGMGNLKIVESTRSRWEQGPEMVMGKTLHYLTVLQLQSQI